MEKKERDSCLASLLYHTKSKMKNSINVAKKPAIYIYNSRLERLMQEDHREFWEAWLHGEFQATL